MTYKVAGIISRSERRTKQAMHNIRKEPREFARLAEVLLSPVLLSPAMNEEEEGFIRLYVMQLAEKYGLEPQKPAGAIDQG